jgi:PAS domain S-box-containing protein
MKEDTFEQANLTKQAATVLRSTAGISAVLVAVVLSVLLPHSETLLYYQAFGVLLSLITFTLTFEPHFADCWHIEAALFFSASLFLWGGIAFEVHDPFPLIIFIVAIPAVTVLLPWEWQFQLGLSLLCIASVVLANRVLPLVHQHDLLWPFEARFGSFTTRLIAIVAESAAVVLATVQLQRKRKQENVYLQALTADAEQFRSLIENSPDGLTVMNAAGNLVFQGPSVKRLLGYDPDDFQHRNMFEFLDADDAPHFRQLLAKCLEFPDINPTITVRCRHADGQWRNIEMVAKHLSNYGSEPLVVFNWRDVSERMTQELRLHLSEEKFRSVFQYSPCAISIAWYDGGRYVEVNDEWLRLFGYTRTEVIGKDPLVLGLWAAPEDLLRFTMEFLFLGTIRNRQTELRAKDGSILSGLLSVVMLETGGKRLALGFFSVLSSRAQLRLFKAPSTIPSVLSALISCETRGDGEVVQLKILGADPKVEAA